MAIVQSDQARSRTAADVADYWLKIKLQYRRIIPKCKPMHQTLAVSPPSDLNPHLVPSRLGRMTPLASD